MKKLFNRFIYLFLMLISIVLPVNAQTFTKGSGTEQDPYLIESTSDLQKLYIMVDLGNTCTNQYFKLTANIDGFKSIGNDTYPFEGTFDGGNHIVNCKSKESGALFNVIQNACIKNVIVRAGHFSDVAKAAGVACTAKNSVFRNCHSRDTLSWGASSSNTVSSVQIGGIVATADANTQILYCSNNAKIVVNPDGVLGSTNVTAVFAGGITGGSGTVISCYNKGRIDISSTSNQVRYFYACGIGGKTIHMCYNTAVVRVVAGANSADVSSAYCYAAGIGVQGSKISYCYNKGNISALSRNSTAASPDCAGGIQVEGSSDNIRCCYNTGSVSSRAGFHGLIGGKINSNSPSYTGTNCYGYAADALNTYGDLFYLKLNLDSTVFYPDLTPNINGGYPILPFQFSRVVVEPNDAKMGSTIGSQNCAIGTSLTISATANEGYYFVQWSDGNKNATRTIKTAMDMNHYIAIFAPYQYTLTVSSNDQIMGTVNAISGKYDYGSNVTLIATANNHYHFEQWSDGNKDAQRTITITNDTTLTAEFTTDKYTITVTGVNGTCTGSGTYGYMEQITLTAIANDNYHFVQWVDGDMNATRQVIVTENKYYTALFEGDPQEITATAEHGSVSGVGIYPYGSYVTLTAIADEHYHFTYWGNGSTNPTLTFHAYSNEHIVAYFAINQHQITASVQNGRGTVEGTGTYDYGTNTSLSVIPVQHYRFVRWSDGNLDNPRAITVTQNMNYLAICDLEQVTITSYPTNGTTLGIGTYNYGSEVKLTAIADEHYHFVNWSDGNNKESRIVIVESDTTFTPIFAPNLYHVTLTAENGVVTGEGDFLYETTTTIVAIPDEHYHFVCWSDGNTNAERSIIVVEDVNLTAIFKHDDIEITWTLGDGSVSHIDYPYNTIISLPNNIEACDDTTQFIGWTKLLNYNGTSTPTDFIDKNANSIKATKNETYYAVYMSKTIINGVSTNKTLSMSQLAKTSGTLQGYTIITSQGSGQTAPAYNATGKDLRIYAKGTLTISSSNTMTDIVFTISSQGKKRLANISANTGTVTMGSGTCSWKGSAKSVTFTVGETASYGTEGSKAGQLCFTAITITSNSSTTLYNYTTTCEQSVNTYTITFKNGDEVLQSTEVEEGTLPSYNGDTPTKPSDAQYTYAFTGWTPEVVPVTGNATYIATYTSTLRKYTVTFLDEDGTTLFSQQWNYGATPTCDEPTKPATAQYTYTFAGWTPEVTSVKGNATYTATYSSVTNQYSIVFIVGPVNYPVVVDYGTPMNTLIANLWSEAEAQYGFTLNIQGDYQYSDGTNVYAFTGWDKDIPETVTGADTYTATYTTAPVQPTALDEIVHTTPAIKVLRNGQLFILRDGKTYTATGVEVE